jgi:competence protein ComGC
MNPPPILPSETSARQSSGLALASMILGICGIVLCLGPLAGIPGVICGHMAHSRIKQSGGTMRGAGQATAGLIMGYLSIAWIFVIGLMAAIAIPNFVKARNQAQFQSCQANLRAIQGAKEVWALENKKARDVEPEDADLFGAGRLINEKPACPARGEYSLNPAQESPTCSRHGEIFRR